MKGGGGGVVQSVKSHACRNSPCVCHSMVFLPQARGLCHSRVGGLSTPTLALQGWGTPRIHSVLQGCVRSEQFNAHMVNRTMYAPPAYSGTAKAVPLHHHHLNSKIVLGFTVTNI